jgi:hypothetical protein
MGIAPRRRAVTGVVPPPPLLLLISTVLFCKGLAPKTSLIRFFNLKNNLFADLCIPFLVPVMEVGHTAAYGGNANRAGGMTDRKSTLRSSTIMVMASSPYPKCTMVSSLSVAHFSHLFMHFALYVVMFFFHNHLVTFGCCGRVSGPRFQSCQVQS